MCCNESNQQVSNQFLIVCDEGGEALMITVSLITDY